ncbi:MAG: phosphate ABC transporter permease PstA [Eubacteriales bacterium]
MNHNLKRKTYENALRGFVYISALITVTLLVLLIGYIFVKGLPHMSWDFLTTGPDHIAKTVGILPNILNTLYVIGLTLLIALPLGVGAAVYLTEYAKNPKFKTIVEFTTETLAGIPSIIYGLVGMLFFARQMALGTSLLSGSLTMTIVILPTIVRTTQESLKTVPVSYREGALGLGSTKWHMIRTIILPSSFDGIVTGCILSVGRIVGESAALLFTAGMGTVIAKDLLSAYQTGGGTLSVALYMYASERADFDSAFAIAATLLVLVFLINSGAKIAQKALKKKNAA